MPGLKVDAEDFEGLNEHEQRMAVVPYRDLFMRVDMLELNQLTLSFSESLDLPGVLMDAIEYVQYVKSELRSKA